MTIRKASCSCGQLWLMTTEEPLRVSVCHCFACQRRTGSVFGAQARFARESVEINGTSTIYNRTGNEGTRILFHFCPECGSTVHYGFHDQPDCVVVPVGAFADPEFPMPEFSVYENRKHFWVEMPPGLERLT